VFKLDRENKAERSAVDAGAADGYEGEHVIISGVEGLERGTTVTLIGSSASVHRRRSAQIDDDGPHTHAHAREHVTVGQHSRPRAVICLIINGSTSLNYGGC
jgi:hypothetical protein